MNTRYTVYFAHRLTVQLLAVITLYFGVHWLIPIVGTTLINGMKDWDLASIFYCWLIQYLFIVASIEFREYLIKRARPFLVSMPKRYLRSTLLVASISIFCILFSFLYLLIKEMSAFSTTILIEVLLLTCQVWCLCGIAMPISAKRFYIFFFKPGYRLNENETWQMPKEHIERKQGLS